MLKSLCTTAAVSTILLTLVAGCMSFNRPQAVSPSQPTQSNSVASKPLTATTPDQQDPAENSIDERGSAQDSGHIATVPPTEEIEPPTDNTVPQPTEEHRQKLRQALVLRVKGMNGEEFAKAIRDWAEVNGNRRPCGFVIYAKQQVKDSKGDSMWQVICYQPQQKPPEQKLKYTVSFHAAGDIFAIFEQ